MHAKFALGRIMITPDAGDHCSKFNVNPSSLIDRHVRGDWSELSADDVTQNTLAIHTKQRILSSFESHCETIYVITEWDRSVTTILLASEY
jgi:hypothetical protein